ncbi:MAG: hypothetical protein M0R37_07650, partial [Bacteroidales bacterium]|nr:hypothetical protein [Bacteroidales bacterium]
GSAAGGTAEFQIGGTAVTLTADDLNALDAASLSATELGYADGAVPGTVAVNKFIVPKTGKVIDTLDITSPMFNGGSVTASAAEINYIDTSVPGTAIASKALVLGANKNADEFHTAALYLGADAGTQVTATAAALNLILPYSASGKKLVSGTMAVPAGASGTAFVPTGLTAAEYIVHSLNGYSTDLSFADAAITTGTVTMKGYCLAGTAALAAGTVTYLAIGT